MLRTGVCCEVKHISSQCWCFASTRCLESLTHFDFKEYFLWAYLGECILNCHCVNLSCSMQSKVWDLYCHLNFLHYNLVVITCYVIIDWVELSIKWKTHAYCYYQAYWKKFLRLKPLIGSVVAQLGQKSCHHFSLDTLHCQWDGLRVDLGLNFHCLFIKSCAQKMLEGKKQSHGDHVEFVRSIEQQVHWDQFMTSLVQWGGSHHSDFELIIGEYVIKASVHSRHYIASSNSNWNENGWVATVMSLFKLVMNFCKLSGLVHFV